MSRLFPLGFAHQAFPKPLDGFRLGIPPMLSSQDAKLAHRLSPVWRHWEQRHRKRIPARTLALSRFFLRSSAIPPVPKITKVRHDRNGKLKASWKKNILQGETAHHSHP